jgi:hypothetical protein
VNSTDLTTLLPACLQVHYLSGPIRVLDKDRAPAQPGEDAAAAAAIAVFMLEGAGF